MYAIGQAVALARGTHGKHWVKQVDRLLSNPGIAVWQLLALWVPCVLGQRTEALVALDWTDFEPDDQTTLVASLMTRHGRPTPLVWLTVRFRQCITVTSHQGELRTAVEWVPKAGRLRTLPQARVTTDPTPSRGMPQGISRTSLATRRVSAP